jgi:uncharacterized YigZ family protein
MSELSTAASTSGYRTVMERTVAEITIKRSVFRAFLDHVTSKDEAIEVVESLRKVHYDAVHHCYAWRLGPDGMDYRMSDDGEPNGTAGKPILFALQRAGLTDAMITVVRWFGGTKLGVGPLARAYADAAKAALETCSPVLIVPRVDLLIHATYDDVSKVIGVLDAHQIEYETEFGDAVMFTTSCPLALIDHVTNEITERTNARAGCVIRPR